MFSQISPVSHTGNAIEFLQFSFKTWRQFVNEYFILRRYGIDIWGVDGKCIMLNILL